MIFVKPPIFYKSLKAQESWISESYKVSEVQNTTDIFVDYEEYKIGKNFELKIDREVVAEDIGVFTCLATGIKESMASRKGIINHKVIDLYLLSSLDGLFDTKASRVMIWVTHAYAREHMI